MQKNFTLLQGWTCCHYENCDSSFPLSLLHSIHVCLDLLSYILSKLKEPCLFSLYFYASCLITPVILIPFLINLDRELPEVDAAHRIWNCNELEVQEDSLHFSVFWVCLLFCILYTVGLLTLVEDVQIFINWNSLQKLRWILNTTFANIQWETYS